MASITSANAVIILTSPLLFPAPVPIQGFAADDIFSVQPLKSAEVLMGVDGILSAGFVFVPIEWDISLQADSASNTFFDTIYSAQQTAQDVYRIGGTVVLPGIATGYTLTNGVMTSYPPMPDAAKTLKMRKFGITWEKILPSPSAIGALLALV